MNDYDLLLLEQERRRRAKLASESTHAPAPEKPDTSWTTPEGAGRLVGSLLSKARSHYAGVGDSFKKTGTGLKQLVSPSEEDVARLQQIEAAQNADPNPGFRKGGEFMGTAGQWVAPGAGIVKGVQTGLGAIPILAQFPKLAKILGVTATGAAASGVQGFTDPVQEKDLKNVLSAKLQNAGQQGAAGAALNLGLAGGGKFFTKAFTPSPEAQKLLDQGIVPTLQQGAEGKAGRFIGGWTSGITDPSKRQVQELQEAVARRWLPGQDVHDRSVGEVVQMIDDEVKKRYGAAFGNNKIVATAADRDRVASAVRNAKVPRVARDEAQEIIQGLFPHSRAPMRMNVESMQRYRDTLEAAIQRYSGGTSGHDKNVRDALLAAKQAFDTNIRQKGMTQQQLDLLKNADDLYSETRAFVGSAERVGPRTKGVKPTDLEFQMSDRQPHAAARETLPLQTDLTGPAARVLGNMSQDKERAALNLTSKLLRFGAAGAAATMAPVTLAPLAVSAAGQTKQGARFLFGDNAYQKRLAELIRRSNPELLSSPLAGDLLED